MASGEFQTATELRGLALPTRRGAGGYFPSASQIDVAWSDLMIALFTPQNGRPMNRSFGTTLYDLLFEPIAAEFELVKLVVRDTATRSCPHLVIQDVSVASPEPEHVEVGVTFALRSDLENLQERSVLLKKTSVSVAGGA